MKYVLWFIFTFIFIYIFYYIVSIRKATRKNKPLAEIQYLISLYRLDITKFSYYRLIRVVALVSSFDIALITTVLMFVDNTIFQLLFGLVIVFPVIILSFLLLGIYYKKKEKMDNTKELEKEKKYLEKLELKKKKKEEKRNNKKKKK